MMKQVPLVVICILISQALAAQPESTSPPPNEIKILSWNIYMLPHLLAARSRKADRAVAIGELLEESDYDVIFFQEAFHPRARRLIWSALENKFPYQAGPANQRTFSLKTNSGLWIFSKYPITDVTSIIYRTRHGVDALSRKGALLVELNVNGQSVQVAGTHLQNDGPEWLKKIQCVEFYERLLKPNTRDGTPQIVCGDFNIDRKTDKEGYESILQFLKAGDTNEDLNVFTYDRVDNQLRNESGNDKDLIDYILLRENGKDIIWSNKVTRMRKPWSANFSDLSDHYGVEAHIIFKDKPVSEVASLQP